MRWCSRADRSLVSAGPRPPRRLRPARRLRHSRIKHPELVIPSLGRRGGCSSPTASSPDVRPDIFDLTDIHLLTSMCGLIGIASTDFLPERRWLADGRDRMRHRGPDDQGEWWSADGRVGFGHRRLAVIDLSAAGHQPMHDARGELTIIYNGE